MFCDQVFFAWRVPPRTVNPVAPYMSPWVAQQKAQGLGEVQVGKATVWAISAQSALK